MQLASFEVRTMREMVTSPDLRHFSLRALALRAQRMGRGLPRRAPGRVASANSATLRNVARHVAWGTGSLAKTGSCAWLAAP